MQVWLNLIGYQVVWFTTVIGAGHSLSWPAWAAAASLWIGHFTVSTHRALDLRLAAFAAAFGICLDGTLTRCGFLRYSPAEPAVPVADSPLWILGLWVAFSTTLTRSLGWLRGRPAAAWLTGAIGGPLAYLGAASGWHVIVFEPPEWRGTLALALSWSITLAVLTHFAAAPPASPAQSRGRDEEPHFR
jgi:Protein of unknown function (DUF2878)